MNLSTCFALWVGKVLWSIDHTAKRWHWVFKKTVVFFLGRKKVSLSQLLFFCNEKMKPKTQISPKLVIPYNPQFSKFIRKTSNRNSSVMTSSVYTPSVYYPAISYPFCLTDFFLWCHSYFVLSFQWIEFALRRTQAPQQWNIY